MAYFNANRPGQDNLAGSVTANFRKLFDTEVLASFSAATVMERLHDIRPLTGADTRDIPVVGLAGSGWFKGPDDTADIDGSQTTPSTKFTCYLDNQVISAYRVWKIEDLKNHWAHRQKYSTNAGLALAAAFDMNSMRVLFSAARASSRLTGTNPLTLAAYPGGTKLVDPDMDNPRTLALKIMAAEQQLRENNVMEQPYALVTPAQYMGMVAEGFLLDNQFGGSGNRSDPSMPRKIGGVEIVVSNNLPILLGKDWSASPTYDSTFAGVHASNATNYRPDLTNSSAIVFTRSAIHTDRLLGVTTEMDYRVEKQSWLFVSSYVAGHAINRPDCAIELAKA